MSSKPPTKRQKSEARSSAAISRLDFYNLRAGLYDPSLTNEDYIDRWLKSYNLSVEIIDGGSGLIEIKNLIKHFEDEISWLIKQYRNSSTNDDSSNNELDIKSTKDKIAEFNDMGELLSDSITRSEASYEVSLELQIHNREMRSRIAKSSYTRAGLLSVYLDGMNYAVHSFNTNLEINKMGIKEARLMHFDKLYRHHKRIYIAFAYYLLNIKSPHISSASQFKNELMIETNKDNLSIDKDSKMGSADFKIGNNRYKVNIGVYATSCYNTVREQVGHQSDQVGSDHAGSFKHFKDLVEKTYHLLADLDAFADWRVNK